MDKQGYKCWLMAHKSYLSSVHCLTKTFACSRKLSGKYKTRDCKTCKDCKITVCNRYYGRRLRNNPLLPSRVPKVPRSPTYLLSDVTFHLSHIVSTAERGKVPPITNQRSIFVDVQSSMWINFPDYRLEPVSILWTSCICEDATY